MFDKCFLDRIELVALGQALDGENLFALHPHRELAARIQVAAVDHHGASAALAAVAADLGAGEAELVAQHFGKRISVLDFDSIILTVDF